MRHTKTQRGREGERPRCTSVGRQRAIGRINPVQAPTRVWAAAPRWLVVMVKVPEAGRVKTRLGRQIGTVVATSFYRAASAAAIGRLARDSRWRTVLAVAPDTGLATRSWPSHRLRVAQGNGDLGQRMQRLFALRPPGPVLIVRMARL